MRVRNPVLTGGRGADLDLDLGLGLGLGSLRLFSFGACAWVRVRAKMHTSAGVCVGIKSRTFAASRGARFDGPSAPAFVQGRHSTRCRSLHEARDAIRVTPRNACASHALPMLASGSRSRVLGCVVGGCCIGSDGIPPPPPTHAPLGEVRSRCFHTRDRGTWGCSQCSRDTRPARTDEEGTTSRSMCPLSRRTVILASDADTNTCEGERLSSFSHASASGLTSHTVPGSNCSTPRSPREYSVTTLAHARAINTTGYSSHGHTVSAHRNPMRRSSARSSVPGTSGRALLPGM